MKTFWALLLATAGLTGCNHSSTPSISKPHPAHAASAASLGGEDGSWDVSGHWLTVSAKQPLAHPVFPFSLVSGGVYSPGELKRALATSDSLRTHYKNFDFKHVRLIRIQNNTQAFVSYRKDGRIFWTKRKLTLHAGELVLADGHYLVRARCANQISFVPQDPVDTTPSDVEGRLDVPSVTSVPMPMDYTRLREVGSPLLPPMQVAPPTTLLAKTYMPAGTLPMLRMSPVCTHCEGSQTSFTNPQPPEKPVPMPDADGITLVIVGLLLMASLVILKKQKNV